MFLEHMNLVQTAEFDWLPWQWKGYFFLHATFTVFWLNIAFIAVHLGGIMMTKTSVRYHLIAICFVDKVRYIKSSKRSSGFVAII